MSKELSVTLIQPPKPKSLLLKTRRQWVRPLGLHYMAAWLKKLDCKVKILDFEKDLVSQSERTTILRDNPANLFGITSTTYTRFEAIKIAMDIKRIFPKSVVIAGGVHFMFVAKDTLSSIDDIDIVCIGEGEHVITSVAKAIASGKNLQQLDDIPGIAFRKDGKIIMTPPQPIVKDIDQFPFYTGFKWDDYPEYVDVGGQSLKAMTIITSRGCPNRCAFCSMGGSSFRTRSPGNVADEIEYFIGRFGIQAVHFFDSTFAASPKHCSAVVNEIINRKLKIKWSCGLRADTPTDLLPLMKEAGLVSFTLGIESGSPDILKSISKGITLEQTEGIIAQAEQLDIRVSPFFMLSHPDETFEKALETLEFRNRIKKYHNLNPMSFSVTMIFPGTEVERLAKQRGILAEDFSWSSPYQSNISERLVMGENVPIYIEKMTPSQIEKILKIDKFNSIQIAHSFPSLVWTGIHTIFAKRDFHSLYYYLSLLLNYISYKIRRRLS
ncbi:B12-binding domain-containing radical SAM protein [Chloroflexota bacterium]